MHLRVIDEGIYSVVAGLGQAAQVYRVGLNLSYGINARFRPGDTQSLRRNVLPRQLIAGRQGAGESDLHRHYLLREVLQMQPQLGWHSPQERYAGRKVEVGF